MMLFNYFMNPHIHIKLESTTTTLIIQFFFQFQDVTKLQKF